MELSSEERAALTARLEQYRERSGFNGGLQRRIHEDNRRRAAVAKRYRQGMIRKAMEAAGINYDDILERQAKENLAARESLTELRAEIATNVPRVAERHERWIKNLLKRTPQMGKKSGGSAPAAIEIGELLEPVLMTYTGTAGQGNIESHGPGKNVFKWSWNHFGDSNGLGEGVGTFSFAFTPAVNGLLGVVMPVAYNGSMTGAIDSSCFEGGSLAITSSTDLLVDQQIPGTTDMSEELAGSGLNYYKGQDASCALQPVYAYVFDEQDLVQTMNSLLVIANHQVKITLTVTITADFQNGGLDVDFFTGEQGVTVPGVLFGLTPV